MIFPVFPIGPKANGDSGCTRFSEALIAFRFCTRIGPTEAQVLPCARPQQCFDTELSEFGSPPPPRFTRFRLANYYFHQAHMASVCSTGGHLQMVKISKGSVRKLKSYEH